jgi:hypothetical protein
VATGLMVQYAQVVQGIGLPWLEGQYLPIDLLGLRKPPRLMMLEGDGQGFADRSHQ